MASYEAEGVVLIDAWEQGEGMGPLGKPVHAKVDRTYRIDDPTDADQALKDAVAFAESVGWRLTPSPISPANQFLGSKDLPSGDGRLFIASGPDPLQDRSNDWILRIHLDYGPVRFEETTTSSN
ncbi:MAG: hypothetical protein L0Z63_02775 [Actinobacteria bacterium]|nr:hypothetical protein [Actinomycetota bacterium]